MLKRDDSRFASKPPVHREGERAPVRFDGRRKRGYSILDHIRRPGNPKVISRLGTKQAIDLEGQDSIAEVAGRNEAHAVSLRLLDSHRIEAIATAPLRNE